jgi:ribosomal protein RSM22 (predicted rRNA methylase)
MTLLPGSLRAALDALAEGRGRRALSASARSITSTYQARGNSREVIGGSDDALAYALARMPATFAAAAQALERLAQAAPEFSPYSLLDAGCGPGTATFAASEVFPSLTEFALIDRNGPFLTLAAALAPDVLGDRTHTISSCELSEAPPLPSADLVIASYLLAELTAGGRTALVQSLWRATGGALVLVEPGTPDGFERLSQARATLVAAGGHVAAPCTHEDACPKAATAAHDWCRFLVRVQRGRDHRLLKGGERPFEDEPFAYLAVMREPATARLSHRIVGRPGETKVQIKLPVCGETGVGTLSVASRNKKIFKEYKKLQWGDAVLNPIQGSDVPDEAAKEG